MTLIKPVIKIEYLMFSFKFGFVLKEIDLCNFIVLLP